MRHKERYAIIKGVEDEEYVVSSSGLFYSLKFGKRREMTQHTDGSGYKYVSVYLKEKNVVFKLRMHIAVALSFIGNIKDGQIVNHKDCDKTNNDVSNLEIISQSANMEHWWKNRDLCKSHMLSESSFEPVDLM